MNEILLTIKLQQQLFMDPKRIRLLKAIDETGSINQGAKLAKVSYKSAWDHLEMMNALSPKPLLERNVGGKKGGGTFLTPYAHRLLKLYQLLEDTQKAAFDILQDENIPLDNPLLATSHFSLQSSARNQFFGKIAFLTQKEKSILVGINLSEVSPPLVTEITAQSAERLQLSLQKEVMMMVKAPWVKVYSSCPMINQNLFESTVEKIEQGEMYLHFGDKKIPQCCIASNNNEAFQLGDKVFFTIDPKQIILATLK